MWSAIKEILQVIVWILTAIKTICDLQDIHRERSEKMFYRHKRRH